MAKVTANGLIDGLSGAIGNLVFRRVGNMTVVGSKSIPRKKQSDHQRANRLKFKEATAYAKQAMHDPQRKAYYQQKAKKLNLPNAYTAAITDFMRKGEISELSIQSHNGKADRRVIIKTKKKDFDVNKVKVVVKDIEGRVLKSGVAVRKASDVFVYTIPPDVSIAAYSVEATIENMGRDESTRTLNLHQILNFSTTIAEA